MLKTVVEHSDIITGFGVLIGLGATGYGIYRLFTLNTPEISATLVVGGLFLTISAISVLKTSPTFIKSVNE